MNTTQFDTTETAMYYQSWKPSRTQLIAAIGKSIPDIIGPDLDVLFCGINPGLYTAAVGHHFARPGNRFWPVIYKSGFTSRELSPFEEELLLQWQIGITNIVNKATAQAADLTIRDLEQGRKTLENKVQAYSPKVIAILGLGAYRIAFNRPKAVNGLQKEMIGTTHIWVLPNPSGLNAAYQIDTLISLFSELHQWISKDEGPEHVS